MTNICSIYQISLLTILDLLLSYCATRFLIIPLLFPDRQFNRPLHFNRLMVGVGKVRTFFSHVYIIEVNLMKFIAKCQKEIKYKVMQRRKSHQYLFLWNTFISQEKNVSISSVANIIHLKTTPLILVGYFNLILMPTFETNHLIVNRKGTTK